MAIEFIDTPTENPEPQFHMDRFVAAMQEARESGAIYFNLWPDVVFAGQTLASAAQAMMLGHAAAGANFSSDKGDADYQSVRGGRIRLRTIGDELRVNDTGRVLKDLRCGPHRICVIDQVLDTGSAAAAA